MTPGTWHVVVGKAKVVTAPARYRLEIERRTAVTLAAQPGRASGAWMAGSPLERTARWYAGDLHVHSRESGDASPTLDAIATFARSRGLDFVELSEHNTTSQLDFMADAQARHPSLLFLPGMEFTTYAGHANAIGATAPLDHRFGIDGASFEGAVAAMEAQGALLSINHPVLDLGQLCIGCAWRQRVSPAKVKAVEIGTGGWDKTGVLFGERALAFWDRQLDQGSRAAPVGECTTGGTHLAFGRRHGLGRKHLLERGGIAARDELRDLRQRPAILEQHARDKELDQVPKTIARLAAIPARLAHGTLTRVVADKALVRHAPLVDPEAVEDVTGDVDKLLQGPFSPQVAILVFPR
jgi:hypothetical protein